MGKGAKAACPPKNRDAQIVKKYYFALWMIIMSAAHAQTQPIFKWTDTNGNVHFSDTPHPGAEEIELLHTQTFTSPRRPSISRSDVEATNDVKITIVQPEDHATIRHPQGYLSLVLDVQPTLKNGNKIQVVLDGTPFGEPQESTFFALKNISRGLHTLVAQIIDKKGKNIKTSKLTTVYMMPPRVGMRKSGH